MCRFVIPARLDNVTLLRGFDDGQRTLGDDPGYTNLRTCALYFLPMVVFSSVRAASCSNTGLYFLPCPDTILPY